MMSKWIQTLAIVASLIGLQGCDEQFLYYKELPQVDGIVDRDIPVKTIFQASKLDILWVIDNSGSMGTYQQAVIQNTGTFINMFTPKKLDWKMGLLSTDDSQNPFVGFTASDQLNSKSPDPINQFQIAVGRLGTSGSGSEKTFKPLVQSLQKFPDFIRKGSSFAVIMVTDAQEQSERGRDWLKEFKLAATNASATYGYGVFAADDFGCNGEGWDYAGSPYEPFLKALDGFKTLKLCDPNFGKLLAEIGQDLIQRSAYYWIALPFRPNAKTMRVSFKGIELKSGLEEVGGVWYYDYDKNAIIFYNLDFASGDQESVHVYAEIDDGSDS